MSTDALRHLIQDLARISGVTLRLCDHHLQTVLLSGDEAAQPTFRTLPTRATLVERAITDQGDFLLLGIFTDQQCQGYLIAGPCQTASTSLANVISTALNGPRPIQIHDDHVKVLPLRLDLAAAESENDAELAQRYQLQNQLADAITRGDPEGLTTISDRIFQTAGFDALMTRVPNRRLRSEKNILYILNTTCRIAAERGHISPVILDRVSGHYARLIEDLITTKTFQQLVNQICRHYCDIVAAQRDNRYSHQVNLTIQFISRHYQQDLTLAELAANVRVTPTHLAHLFKQETGETLFAFINRFRIQMAQRQLHYQTESIMDVAFQVGFNNVTYFNKMFKRYTGITPSAYLRNSRPTIPTAHLD
ncbi:helix-turn-helix domain-containing protein [Levilactobacillus zymae]|uniref:helix-turn-helix transcriptional regulator n=1 Tax=Levilactobacillus zymae TaxID=267363 RepID=UPI0028BC7031|nr:helix-turn-helix domain-containing protein [Levilactobacillus zymae]MDT6979560.1 helix-turn-helix domain-containing protein [Levilactobacillus zymae]